MKIDYKGRCLSCMHQMSSQESCPHCGWLIGVGPQMPHYLAPGTILQDKYLIGKVLGQGGFGITYLAWDLNLDLKLAIKEFYPQGLVSRMPGQSEVSAYTGSLKNQYAFGLDRFLSEAKTLARFSDHPNIVSVRDFFRSNGTAYMVMNYVEGVTFEEYLKQKGGKIDYAQALAIMMPVLDALREVHQAGIMHRDISPDNIFIDTLGRVMLIDFGAARLEMQQKNRSLSVIMKAGYSPEEQYRTRGEQGPWTDIYALAATFYRAITGVTPVESLDRLEDDILEPPSALGVTIDKAQEAVLLKALAIRSMGRYRSIAELQEALLHKTEVAAENQQEISEGLEPAAQPEAAAVLEKPLEEQASTVSESPEERAVAKSKPGKGAKSVLTEIHPMLLLASCLFIVLIGSAYVLTIFDVFNFDLKALTDEMNLDQSITALSPLETSEIVYSQGTPEVLFTEDFNSGVASNWDYMGDSLTGDNADWSIRGSDEGYYFEGKGHIFTRPNFMRTGLSDHATSFIFKLIEYSPVVQPFNFSFREFSNPGHKRYFLSISNDGIDLIKQSTQSHVTLSDRDFTTLSRYKQAINKNRWYKVEVVLEGKYIRVYLDDKLVIEYTDQVNPYLHGGIAFETLDDARVAIDDIQVTRKKLEGVEVLFEEEEQVYIPSLQATTKALRFFEENIRGNANATRTYDKRFAAEDSKLIWWELYMACEAGRKTDFQLKADYYDSNNELLYSDVVDGLFVDSGWTESLHAAGFGYSVPGRWKPGVYTVKLYLDDGQIAEGRFQIYAQAEGDSSAGDDLAGVYTIDNEFGTIPISELPIGARVVDPSWEWEFRTGSYYTHESDSDIKPVTWLVVAKNHYSDLEPHVTLLSEELIGRFTFDNSTDRGSYGGRNHWGESGKGNASRGLLPWLNSTGLHTGEGFYQAFSISFIQAVLITSVPNWDSEDGSVYSTNNHVFVPSTSELGDSDHEWTNPIGSVYAYFQEASDAKRMARLGGDALWYWTRSPDARYEHTTRLVTNSGAFNTDFAYQADNAVRPVINLKSGTLVNDLTY